MVNQVKISGLKFKKALKVADLTQQDAANLIGVSRQTVNTWTKLEEIDERTLQLVKSKLNIDLQSQSESEEKTPNGKALGDINYPLEPEETPFIPLGDGQYVMVIPLVNEYAYAGYLAGYKDHEYIEELPKHTIVVNKHHRGAYQAFEVIGDSMRNPEMLEESILDGSIVTGRQVLQHHWKSKLHTHRWKDFVIVHKEGILIKRIKEHQVIDGTVVLESLNPDKQLYPDREIHLNDVYQIFNIVNVSQSR